jgi:hypothetical protein
MSVSGICARLRRLGAVAVTVLGLGAVGLPALTVPSQPAEAGVFVSVGAPGWGWWGYRPYWGYYRPAYWHWRGYYHPYWRGHYWGWRHGCGWHRCW